MDILVHRIQVVADTLREALSPTSMGVKFDSTKGEIRIHPRARDYATFIGDIQTKLQEHLGDDRGHAEPGNPTPLAVYLLLKSGGNGPAQTFITWFVDKYGDQWNHAGFIRQMNTPSGYLGTPYKMMYGKNLAEFGRSYEHLVSDAEDAVDDAGQGEHVIAEIKAGALGRESHVQRDVLVPGDVFATVRI